MQKTHIHWFRKGLRIHDNPALKRALASKKEGKAVLPLFIIDPWFMDPSHVGVNRYAFLLETLSDLNISLQKLGLRLVVAKGGQPQEVMQKFFKILDVDLLTYEFDTEPYAKKRDELVHQVCKDNNVKVEHFVSHTLFDPEFLFARNDGEIPKTYQTFLKLLHKVPKPCDTTEKFSEKDLQLPKELKDPLTKSISKGDQTIELYQNTPNMKEFKAYSGLKTGKKLIGGESVALNILDKFCENTEHVASFRKPMTKPTALKPETTTLSPYLKFGSISVRTFYWEIQKVYDACRNHTQPPESLHGQIFFREYFYFCGHYCEIFDKMEGNYTMKQIEWSRDQEKLDAWEKGMTGYPAVDASMRQLQKEGWIHHLARHLVACFLTRGDLWVHWELGAKTFDKLLLDADWSLNNANWQWLSASRFFSQYFKVYSPIAFFQKSDPQGLYIKKYCPELKNYPKNLIYNPWKATPAQQKEFGCIIGKDYPAPIVDHDVVRPINLDRMKTAYANQDQIIKKLSYAKAGHKTLPMTAQKAESKQLIKRKNVSKKVMKYDSDEEDEDYIVESNVSKKRDLKIQRKSVKKLKNQSTLKFGSPSDPESDSSGFQP